MSQSEGEVIIKEIVVSDFTNKFHVDVKFYVSGDTNFLVDQV